MLTSLKITVSLFLCFFFQDVQAHLVQKTQNSKEYLTTLKYIQTHQLYKFVDSLHFIKNFNEQDSSGNTLSHYMVNTSESYLNFYFKYPNINLNIKNALGFTPLHLAIKKADSTLVHFFVKNGANIHQKDKEGNTPFLLAVYNSHSSFILALLQNYPKDFNTPNTQGVVPLHILAFRGMTSLVKNLLDMKTPVNIQDNDGISALHYASARNRLSVVKILLQYNALISIKDAKGHTPLYNSIVEGNKDITRYLISRGASLKYLDPKKRNFLQVAIFNEQYSMADMLLNVYKINPFHKDIYGSNSLFYIIKSNWVSFLPKFKNPKIINAPNNEGLTPLMFALKLHRKSFVEALENTGLIDWNKKDLKGNTLVNYAIQYNNTSLLYKLKKHPHLFFHKNIYGHRGVYTAIHTFNGVAINFYIKYFPQVFKNQARNIQYYNFLKKKKKYYLARKIKKKFIY